MFWERRSGVCLWSFLAFCAGVSEAAVVVEEKHKFGFVPPVAKTANIAWAFYVARGELEVKKWRPSQASVQVWAFSGAKRTF